MKSEFQYLAILKNESLLIYGDWIDSTADMALARRWDDSAQVLVYRGMAHRREIDEDALMLIICHEIGHLYGGTPYKHEYSKISVEGQADYFSTKFCLPQALKSWADEDVEERVLKAILNVGNFLANNWQVPLPRFDTPDSRVVDETNLKHPHPQCRLDTYVAGLESLQRPRCWFCPLD